MDNSIIVKNLPVDVYIPELCDIFRCFGNIVSATVDTDDSKSGSEAYIAFEKGFSALEAAKRMNKFRLRNRSLKVLMSSENERFRKVFVKNFSPSWDECDLLKEFEDIGIIEGAKISEDKGKSNGYGFIVFKDHSAAKNAVATMNGVRIDGHTLKVERFKSKPERESLMQNSLEHVEGMLIKSIQLNNLHVKNLPPDMKEHEFKKLFEKHGEILSVKIMTDDRGASKGFGFVSFAKEENAAKALERMDKYVLRGKKLQISFKEDRRLRKQYYSLKNQALNVKIKQSNQRSMSVSRLIPRPLTYKI